MFELFFLFIVIVDCIVVGMFVSGICVRLFGDTPGARLIRLLFTIGSAIGYGHMCLNFLFGETEAGDGTIIFAVFTPVALVLILKVIDYMYSGNSENKD